MKRIYPIGEAPPVGEVPTHMYAWTIRPERYGAPALAYVLEEVEVPEPADDEVLVWVMAAGINYNGVWAALGEPMDVIAARRARGEQGADFHICGSDASGIVYRVGRGVTSVRVGDEVAVHGAQWSADCPMVRAGLDPVLSPTFKAWGYETSWGSFAQFAKVQAHQCLPKPERLTWEEAACFLAAGASAYRMLHMFDPVRPGDAVLVWGAAGGLGSMAVQLARLAGARPVAVIGSGARREFCLDLGAEGCVERSRFGHWGALPDCDDEAAYEAWLKGVRGFGRAVWEALGTRDNPRLVIEHPGEDTIPSSLFVCAPGGMVVTCGGTSGYNGSLDLRYLWIRQKRLQGSHGFDDHQAGAVNELVARGLIRPGLSRAFGFHELPLALQLMYENQHPPGNMAVLVSSPALGLGIKDSRRARATALTAGAAGWKVRSGGLRSLAIAGAAERPEDGSEITVPSLVEESGFREALGVSLRAAECAWSALEDAGRDPLDRKDLRIHVADPEDSLTRLAEACREIEEGSEDTALLVSESPLGAVALVVRRLEDARRDGDPVKAVLRVLEAPGHRCAGLDSVARAAAGLGSIPGMGSGMGARLLEVAGPGGSRVVLEEVLPERSSLAALETPGARLLTLSARTPAALDAAAERLADHLDAHPGTPLDGAAFTLQTGRPRLARRRAVVCRDSADAVKALREPSRYLDGRGETADGRQVVFLLPGGGVQYPGMSRGLYRSEPVFRQEIDRCAELLQPALGLDLRTLLYPSDEETERARQELSRPAIFLPALFAVEYAQARLWMSWGIRPAAMIGHSFGEYVAACLAGVFSLEDALALVAYRGELFKTLPGGAMLTVSLPEAELVRRLPEDLALAVVNGPALCVLSGPGESVRAFAAELAAEGVEHKLLPVAGASHTPMVAPILPALTRFVEGLERRPPQIPYISNVTGTWITAGQAMDPEYWALHSRSTVRFSHGLAELLAEPGRLLLEVGPGKTLSSLARLQGAADVVSSIRHPNDPVADEDFLLAALGRLWAAGVPVDWDVLHRGERPRRVSLPAYPFGLEVGESVGEELGDVESSLAAFFRELLGVETVRKTDSFFDLGGHSLLGTRLLSRVREALGVELPLRRLFEAPTLGALAASVEAARGAGAGDDGPPVAPVPREGFLPLSFAQQRLWFVDQMEPGNPFYNLPLAWSLEGPLSISSLAGALTEVVRRHEALRTAFPSVDGQPHQAVLPAVPVALPVADLSALPEEARGEEARRLAADHVARPFHLDRGPLFRALLLVQGTERHALVVAVHHIVFDRWSLGVFSRELRALYAGSALPELAVQYADYASWLRDRMSGGRLEEQLSWWTDRLTGLEPLDLPGDRPRPPVQSFRGSRLPVELPEELTPALQTVARQEGATPFMVLMAAYQALLARWAGREDIAVGTPIAGRIRAELEPLVGFFVNTLVLRADLSGGPTFREHLRRVRETVLGAYAHQEIPFERLVEELQPARDLSRNALFEAVFAFQNVPTAGLELPGLAVAPIEVESRSAKTDLALFLWQDGDRLKGYLEYALDLFDAPTPGRLASQLARLLREACADPGQPVADLRLLETHEEQQILREWGGGPIPFPGNRGVHELFSEVAARRPEAIALSWDGGEWTYGELERRAEALAHRLRAQGVGLESRVAVLVERSPDLIAGQLAVLKAGGAYVPLDRGLPEERLRFLLSDTGIVTAIARPEMKDRLAAWGVEAVDPGADEDAPSGSLPDAAGGDLAYIMFTSGSTGVPKGVAVTHRNILRLVSGQTYARMGPDEVMIQLAPVSFDAATFEVWACLLHGGRLVLGPAQPPSLEELSSLVRRHGVTALWLTSGLFNQVVDHAPEALAGLRQLLAGGDMLSVPHVRRALERLGAGARLINGYGPTETTTFAVTHALEAGEGVDGAVPIGRPIANTEACVLDAGLRPVPPGIPGELYLGGAGVARGYWSRPALTAERFVPHPFAQGSGERLYRTGDLVRWRADGRLEFLGRVDRQVKIRGFRIEPGEIESVLLQADGVQEAAVLARADRSGDKTLVAFVVPEPGRSLEARELREALGRALPSYFVPGAFVLLPELPLSRTGKIDRRELLRLAGTAAAPEETGYVAPQGPVEEALAGLFGTLLGRERVSADDDFFELGGHSLLAIQLTARLRDAFGVDLPLRALFEEPTLSALAARIEREMPEAGPDADRILRQDRHPEGDVFPLSFPQERLWSASRLPGSEALFNVARGFRLAGPLNEQVLQEALALVVGRHEALRATFAHEGGRPVQRVAPAAGFDMEVTDLAWMPETERREEALRLAAEDARQPFDLQRGPLFRARLLRLGEEERWLVLTLHHIVTDGWSMGVLYRELGAAFEALGEGRLPELPELPIQYPDFAAWQREQRGPELEAQIDWWRQRLAGVPVLELPADRPRMAVPTVRGGVASLPAGPELAAALRALGRAEGASLFMTALAALQTLLARYTGQADLAVGSPVAGRLRPEVEGLVGFFVNLLVFRADLSGDPSFRGLLAQARESALDAFAHQEAPFERLVEALQPRRNPGQNPLFQVHLAVQSTGEERLRLAGVESEPFELRGAVAQWDVALVLEEREHGFDLIANYKADLFDRATIDRLLGHARNLLASAAADPGRRISELRLLGEAEEREILADWNRTEREIPHGLPAHRLFEARSAEAPEAPALLFGDAVVTYGELEARSNRLARHLRRLGVRLEDRVGLCLDRGPDLVAAMLAVQKAGGAYVALDPAYPADRLGFILADSGIQFLVSSGDLADGLPGRPELTLLLDLAEEEIGLESPLALEDGPGPDNLAYVVYTSGSTGRPKGVLLAHRGLANLGEVQRSDYEIGPGSRLLQFASASFDASVSEIYTALAGGAALCLGTREELMPGPALTRLLREREVTAAILPPSALAMLDPADVPALRTLVVAGEACPPELARRWSGAGRRFVNAYGPTEITVCAAHADCGPDLPEGERPPIGRPLANVRVYVVDPAGQALPVGVPGELWVSSPGLARGYHGRPGLTAERFVPDPFAAEPGGRLYRTGDLVRWRPDGQLDFLGRLDQQVKLRGFRIEPGEIESALRSHPRVGEAVVVLRELRSGEMGLVAYTAGDAGEPELRGHLRERLPEHMVPAAFVSVAALPLSPNGKVDRRALPDPREAAPARAEAVQAPATSLERTVAEVWAGILGRDVAEIGLHDNFFDIGGHSLALVEVFQKLVETLGRDLPLMDLFENPTVASLAAQFGGEEISAAPDVDDLVERQRSAISERPAWRMEEAFDE